jgi:transposase
MRIIGIDLGKINSQVSERDERGEEVRSVRVQSDRASLVETLSGPKARVLIEAGTPARWVANCLREAGHEVVVADPGYLPMYVDLKSKRKKTDKRDAALLSQALLNGMWRPAHERSEEEQIRKMRIDSRSRHVGTRTMLINAIKAAFHSFGLDQVKGKPEAQPAAMRLALSQLPEAARGVVETDIAALEAQNVIVAKLDEEIAATSGQNPHVQRLMTVPGVGLITAATFVATIDNPHRFANGHELASHLGTAPSEHSSGERRLLGSITKAGPKYLRILLVQAAWSIWRSTDPAAARLRAWVHQIGERRGRKTAIVALARKLAGILLAMWKKESDFRPEASAARSPLTAP